MLGEPLFERGQLARVGGVGAQFVHARPARLPDVHAGNVDRREGYRIRHGDEVLIWDAGFAKGNTPTAPKASIPELLPQLGVSLAHVKYMGLSHCHGDHIGQANLFPQATLLVRNGDWDVLSATKLTPNQAPIAPWLTGGSKMELLTGDLAHFHENDDSNGVPSFNTDRAATLASLDRFKQIAKDLEATVIIQHDARDIAKSSAFPGAAR
jgi:glyoxylase-like metal-dependent hydrolase (beta-lactamase superfamily II)